MTVTDTGGWQNEEPVYWVAAFEPQSYLDAEPGEPITWAFMESGSSPMGDMARPLTSAEKANIREAVEVVGQDIGLTFVETSAADPHILFAAGPSASAGAAGRAFNRFDAPEQVWAYDDGYDTTDGLAENTYIYKHELLHGLGLFHSTDRYGDAGPVRIDGEEADGTTLFGNWPPYWQNDIQLFDFAALHYLHGPDPTQRAGDDTYTQDPDAFDPDGPRAQWPLLWDGGGTDTLDYSGRADDVSISLAPGTVNRVGAPETAGILDAGTFSIHYNTWIENLVGGDGDDALTGNERDNRLTGGEDDDAIVGGLGSDTAVYAGPRAAYTVTRLSDGVQVRDTAGGEGTDTLSGVEALAFADGTLTMAELFLDGGPEAGPTPVTFSEPLSVAVVERGGDGNDVLTVGVGGYNTGFDAGGGRDTVVYELASESVRFHIGEEYVDIQRPQARDGLVSVERVQFTDGTLAFDVDGNAGMAYRIYQAAFDRTPDIAGLGFWVRQLDEGAHTPVSMAAGFIGSDEFRDTYGAEVSDDALVTLLYRNVLDRDPDDEGLNWWRDRLADGTHTPASALAGFAESPENQALVADQIDDGVWYV
jgi:hypothetical protein